MTTEQSKQLKVGDRVYFDGEQAEWLAEKAGGEERLIEFLKAGLCYVTAARTRRPR
jgi:hypothetical protein